MKNPISVFFKGDLIRASSMIVLATLSGSAIAFLANLYLSSTLGPKFFGVFKTLIYLFTFLSFLVGFGMQSTLPKYIAEFKTKNKKKIGHLVNWFLKIRGIGFLIIGILIFLMRDKIALYLLHDVSLSYLIFPALAFLVASFFQMFIYIVLGYQKFRLFAVSLFLSSTLSAVLAVALSPFGLFYIISGWACGTAIGFLITLRYLFHEHAFSSTIHFNLHKIIWKFSMPMYGLWIIFSLVSVAVPFFSLFFSQLLIGYYSYALMFYTASLLIPTAISYVVLPRVSELISLKKMKIAKEILTRALKLYTPLVAIGIVTVLLASEFFILKISPEYFPSLTLFRSVIIFGLLSGCLLILSFYLQGKGKVKETALIILSQTILLFLISFILLRTFV